MFLDEARLAAGIHHPNVVPILEVGASERGYYLVMEYIEGDTLARLLARAATSGRRLPISVGIKVVVDMLLGLHAAHELRDEHGGAIELVHRDVSPQNILVGVDGNTRITDFGVARAASRLSATRAGQLKGKIAYMAPEQAVGDPTVDRRADVFSAGIVLWEVLAAKRLFKAENEAATLSRVISEPIPHISEINPDISQELGEVVMKALARDRDDRYSNCQDLADDLERLAAPVKQMAPAREVAGYVSEVIGQEIAQQREAVRAWLARSEPSQAIPDMVEIPHSGVPQPLMGAPTGSGGEQSGMVASPIAAPLGAPSLETGGPSRAPLVIGAAAIFGFIVVGGLVMFSGRQRDDPNRSAPAATVPAAVATAQVATAAPSAPPPSSTAPPASSSGIEITEEPTSSPAKGRSGAKLVRVPGPTARPQPAAAAPAPAPKPAKPAEPGEDLSNPYR
jgi:serine/threonine-protein kinase